jgi:hypothetical protein
MSRATVIRIVFNLVLGAVAASSAHAQGKPPGTVTFSAAATGFRQFSSDLEPLGTVSASNAALSASVTRQMVAAFAAGISARLSSEDWQFDSPAAFGGSPPWHQLQRSSVGVSLSLALSKTVLIGVSPSLEWALENDAESEDALTYGAVVSALKVLKPDLILGAGASVYRQFYSIKTSPFLIINWKLSEKLRIANALPAGPEGGPASNCVGRSRRIGSWPEAASCVPSATGSRPSAPRRETLPRPPACRCSCGSRASWDPISRRISTPA